MRACVRSCLCVRAYGRAACMRVRMGVCVCLHPCVYVCVFAWVWVYVCQQHALPEGGRFNKHTSKTVFEIELIPTRDIPGPGTYDNLRQVFPSDPAGIRYYVDVYIYINICEKYMYICICIYN